MRIIPGRIRYIAEAQHVQLGVSATSCGIDGEQNRPCNQACGKASRTHDSQKTQEQIAVDGRVVQNMGVGNFKERPEPVEEARRELGTPFATETLSISSQAQFNEGGTYCVCQHGRCVLGAYHRIWVRRQIKNRPNQNVASTSAGTRVVTNADSDVEPPPPNAEMTSEAAVEALPRASPMLGSLAGFCACVSAVSPMSISRWTSYKGVHPLNDEIQRGRLNHDGHRGEHSWSSTRQEVDIRGCQKQERVIGIIRVPEMNYFRLNRGPLTQVTKLQRP